MSEPQIATELAKINQRLDTDLGKINARLDALEKISVSKADVFGAVLTSQAVFYAGAVFIIIVLNAVGAFN